MSNLPLIKIPNIEFVDVLHENTNRSVYLVNYFDESKNITYLCALKKCKLIQNYVYTIEHVRNEKEILDKIKNYPLCVHCMDYTNSINPYEISSLGGSFTMDDCAYNLLEYCEKGDLYEHMMKNPIFPYYTVKFYSSCILLAIEYLHSINIIHRDIKPENLLIVKSGHCVLTDFGTSIIFNKSIDLYDIKMFGCIGTQDYFCPEMLEDIEYNHHVDWWQFACTVYYLLYKNTPFSPIGVDEENEEYSELLYENIINVDFYFPTSRTFLCREKDICNASDNLKLEDLYDISDAKDLISSILRINHKERLGYYKGAEEIKNHKFFNDVNFNDLIMNVKR